MSRLVLVVLAVAGMCTLAAGVDVCAGKPTVKCDFFIKHSWMEVPTLTIPTHEVNEVITNNPILHWTGDVVTTATSDPCVFADQFGGVCGGAFYFMSKIGDWNHTNLIGSHPLNAATIGRFRSRCVILPMNNFRLAKFGWVNVGTEYQKFPKARRCIAFKTSSKAH